MDVEEQEASTLVPSSPQDRACDNFIFFDDEILLVYRSIVSMRFWPVTVCISDGVNPCSLSVVTTDALMQ